MFDRKILTDNFKFNTQSPKTLLPKFNKKIFSGTTLDLVSKLLKKLSIFSYLITSYHMVMVSTKKTSQDKLLQKIIFFCTVFVLRLSKNEKSPFTLYYWALESE